MSTINLSSYQIRTLKKIGFRDQELVHFTQSKANDTIAKFFKMNKLRRRETKDMMRRG